MKLHATALAAMTIALTMISGSEAKAGYDTPIYAAACEYRDAVRHFEDAVRRARYFDRYQERIVDDLEDASGDLRRAARRPHDVNRLFRVWNVIEALHPQVEYAVFGHAPCAASREIAVCWERVSRAYDAVALQIAACRHPGSVPGYNYMRPRQNIVPSLYSVPSVSVFRQPINNSRFKSPRVTHNPRFVRPDVPRQQRGIRWSDDPRHRDPRFTDPFKSRRSQVDRRQPNRTAYNRMDIDAIRSAQARNRVPDVRGGTRPQDRRARPQDRRPSNRNRNDSRRSVNGADIGALISRVLN